MCSHFYLAYLAWLVVVAGISYLVYRYGDRKLRYAEPAICNQLVVAYFQYIQVECALCHNMCYSSAAQVLLAVVSQPISFVQHG